MNIEMSTEEKLVLCVLRHANQIAPSVSAICRLSGLDRSAVEQILRQLMVMGLCEQGSTEEEERYWAVALSKTPILGDPLEWLAEFCSRPIAVDYGDSDAVCYEMSGIVLLVAVVMGAREPALIAALTKLPGSFIGIIIELCHRLDLWWSPWFYALESVIRKRSDDADAISAALSNVKEEFWWAWLSPRIEEELGRARGSRRYGGATDPWAIMLDREQARTSLTRLN
jgi:hypothetical protein